MTTEEKLFQLELLVNTMCASIKPPLSKMKMDILYIVKCYSPARPSIILSKLGLKKSNLASAVKFLEEKGMLVSKKNSEDKRGRFYTLTEKGNEILDEYFSKISAFLRTDANTIDEALEVLNKKI